MKFVVVVFLALSSVLSASALDRNAFTFINYNLTVQLEPEQHRLGASGRITLRNDSSVTQKNAALQISSTLTWRSIQADGKPLQFVSQPYESDIDHTGDLSEAIITLPKEVAPKGQVDLDVRYEGTIPLDATRLTRIGTPKDVAAHTDWDQISTDFVGVRGIGYVTWYPVSTEAASLSEGDTVFETIGRWKAREHGSHMALTVTSTADGKLFASGSMSPATIAPNDGTKSAVSATVADLSQSVPTIVSGDYLELAAGKQSLISYTKGYEAEAKLYADALAKAELSLSDMIKPAPLKVVQLPDASAAPFATEGILSTPLLPNVNSAVESLLVYAAARTSVKASYLWIREGLAHLAQARRVEQQEGRLAAIEYLNLHLPALLEIEKEAVSKTGDDRSTPPAQRALTDGIDDIYLQTKSMFVFWMLKDMLGDANFNSTMMTMSRGATSNDPKSLQQLVQSPDRDLAWFFDDWVYHDRGLPDFKVESVYSSKTATGYLVTITVDNLGSAGAEVPVALRTEGGPIGKRLVVRGKSKASLRMDTNSVPLDVTVNDGSVPESDTSNNTYMIPTASAK
jgi:hypothetical protein